MALARNVTPGVGARLIVYSSGHANWNAVAIARARARYARKRCRATLGTRARIA